MAEEIKVYEDMIGKVFTKVHIIKESENPTGYPIQKFNSYSKEYYTEKQWGDIIIFENDAEVVYFYHQGQCCEDVHVDDIVGELSLLENSPILMAEELTRCVDNPRDYDEYSLTFTFYKFATINGHVNIKWYGSSNGFYSEEVDHSHYDKTLSL
jgi:hypothetical protein